MVGRKTKTTKKRYRCHRSKCLLLLCAGSGVAALFGVAVRVGLLAVARGTVVATRTKKGVVGTGPDVRSARALSPFEEHYLRVYLRGTSAGVAASINTTTSSSGGGGRRRPTKFLLLSFKTHGHGNKVRSLCGAMFLAALTDRILLVDSPRFTAIFDPPILNGTTLDWNPALARGACTSSIPGKSVFGSGIDDGSVLHLTEFQGTAEYVENFTQRYDNCTCLVLSASFGFDRVVLIHNEAAYASKVERLFGHATSRYNWVRHALSLVLQRPKQNILDATRSVMDRIGLSSVPFERRVGVHIRGWFDWDEARKEAVRRQADVLWTCITGLLRQRVVETREQQYQGMVAAARNNRSTSKEEEGPNAAGLTVLFVSDTPAYQSEASERILGNVAGITKVLQSGLEVIQSAEPPPSESEGRQNNSTVENSSPDGGSISGSPGSNDNETAAATIHPDMLPFVDWFLLGECSMIIATGHSSYGTTAHFRPSSFPPTNMDQKLLYIVSMTYEKFQHTYNQDCGLVKQEGYVDLTMGIQDPEGKIMLAKHPNRTTSATEQQMLLKKGGVRGSIKMHTRSMN